ncbi:30S ribosomal protein S20 [Myxococcota bacterium]|nr:30S ribosomal protein S20 [Myxococcota bacterium]
MANIASAIKRARQAEKRRQRNSYHRTTMRTYIKKVRKALDSGDVAGAQAALTSAVAVIDKTSSRGVIHRNTAARRISRLVQAVQKAAAPETAA